MPASREAQNVFEQVSRHLQQIKDLIDTLPVLQDEFGDKHEVFVLGIVGIDNEDNTYNAKALSVLTMHQKIYCVGKFIQKLPPPAMLELLMYHANGCGKPGQESDHA